VVELVTAVCVEHAGSVELESSLVSFDGNGDWALGDSVFQSLVIVDVDISVCRDGDGGFGERRFASLINSLVWVVFLGSETLVGNYVFESVIHQSTVAALVALSARAINELLFGDGDEGFLLDGNSAFNRASGGESPARTALALVLDIGDGLLGAPVNVWGVLQVLVSQQSGLGWGVLRDDEIAFDVVVASVFGMELMERHVTEFVHAKSVGQVLLVGGGDEVQIALEHVVG